MNAKCPEECLLGLSPWWAFTSSFLGPLRSWNCVELLLSFSASELLPPVWVFSLLAMTEDKPQGKIWRWIWASALSTSFFLGYWPLRSFCCLGSTLPSVLFCFVLIFYLGFLVVFSGEWSDTYRSSIIVSGSLSWRLCLEAHWFCSGNKFHHRFEFTLIFLLPLFCQEQYMIHGSWNNTVRSTYFSWVESSDSWLTGTTSKCCCGYCCNNCTRNKK